MVRGKKSGGAGSFTTAEAKFILESLVRDGRVAMDTVQEYKSRHQDAITGYLERLKELGVDVAHAGSTAAHAGAKAVSEAATSVHAAASAAVESVKKAAKRAGKKATAAISPERELTRQLQGQFLGLSRAITDPKVKANFSQQYKSVQGEAKRPVIAAMRRHVDSSKITTSARGQKKAPSPTHRRRT